MRGLFSVARPLTRRVAASNADPSPAHAGARGETLFSTLGAKPVEAPWQGRDRVVLWRPFRARTMGESGTVASRFALATGYLLPRLRRERRAANGERRATNTHARTASSPPVSAARRTRRRRGGCRRGRRGRAGQPGRGRGSVPRGGA